MTTISDTPIQTNTTTITDQRESQITMLQGGGAVVVWWDTGDFDPRASAVRAQVYDSDGNPVGSEITVDAPTNAFVDGEPSVAPLTGGGFVVGWSPYPNAELGTPSYVAMQVYSATGQPQGSQIVISNPSRFNTDIELAPTASGGFLAVWSNNATDNPGAEFGNILGQFFDVSGAPIGGSFMVDLSRVCTAPSARLSHLSFECDGAFPAQC